ncbi:unnamed protein product [Lupinus luteus]|uniref:CRAL-TRIO domain-containing protein n=1 Tax=Lupinus luteus TaxID=3873 RepID=A0AAV1XUM9_LUPLU
MEDKEKDKEKERKKKQREKCREEDYYPKRLGKLLVVHAPYMFMKVWKLIYPVLDDKTKKKIIFIENKKLKSTMMEDIDENQLPEIYGGPLPLVPILHI